MLQANSPLNIILINFNFSKNRLKREFLFRIINDQKYNRIKKITLHQSVIYTKPANKRPNMSRKDKNKTLREHKKSATKSHFLKNIIYGNNTT